MSITHLLENIAQPEEIKAALVKVTRRSTTRGSGKIAAEQTILEDTMEINRAIYLFEDVLSGQPIGVVLSPQLISDISAWIVRNRT